MAAGKDTGRVVGLTVSLGVGLAIAVGGLGEAVADPTDSSTSSDTASSDSDGPAKSSADSHDDDSDALRSEAFSRQDPETESATQDEPDEPDEPGELDELDEPNEPDEPDEPDADGLDRGGVVSETLQDTETSQEMQDIQSELSPEPPEAEEAPSVIDDDPNPTPAQTQAVAVMLAAAHHRSQEGADDTVDAPQAPSAALPLERDSHGDSSQPIASASAMNSPPTVTATVADPDPISSTTRVTVTAVDPDADTLTYTATRPILGNVVGDGTGNFTYTPMMFVRVLTRFLPFLNPLLGSDRFSITASDGRGGTASVNVKTTIVPMNSAPRTGGVTVNSPATSTGEVTGKANATDPNWDNLTYLAATTVTAKGSVTIGNNGTFTYTPTAAARHQASATAATAVDQTDTFAVTVSDQYGALTDIPVTVAISPLNEIPTGTAHIDALDLSSGVVSGMLAGFDGDGDSLTYSGPTSTLKGSVVVNADGSFTYTPSEAARYHAAHTYALPYDTSDSFGITVDDGHGGVAAIPVNVVISPGDPSAAAPPLSTFCGCTLLPADAIFHADLRGLPAMAESDTWIDLLGGSQAATLHARWGGNEWMGSTGGHPVNVVDADHPKEDVVFNRGYSTTGPGIDDRPYAIPDRPLVEGMPSYPAWDRHLLVFQKGTCISQELYNVANGVELPAAGVLDALGNATYAAIWGSTWIAEAGAQYDMNSLLYPEIGHANASRLPYLPMILRPDDLERGYIDHMLGITIAKDVGAGYVWPALAGDGSAADGIPMGTVFRLRHDVDISHYAQSTQVILRALQVHGAVVFDSTAPGSDGAVLLATSNGWEDTDYVTAKSELSTIPISLFEAVDAASLAVDPATRWQIR